ncbi:MFS transporter [Paenibacillus cisolokensis]|uniref:MFS transporter n=1 Tax=Paenibacillus cisolokensis TaxID=1658519 RepID=UPI003D2E0EC2
MERTAVLEQKQGLRELMKIRSFMVYVAAQTMTRFGDSVDSIAYSWLVYILTGSELLMGSLFAFNFVPNLLFSLFTGTLVDRWSKRKVLAAVYIGRGGMVAVTAALYALGWLEVWHLFAITFIISTLECFSKPAEMSVVPRLLPKEQLLAGNSIFSSLNRTAELVGLSAAGALIAFIGISGTILVVSVTFTATAVTVLTLRGLDAQDPAADEEEKAGGAVQKSRTMIADIKEALAFVKSHSLLLGTTALAVVINFCVAPLNVLQPVYVRESLGAGSAGMSVLGTALLLGMIAGSLGVGQYGKRYKKSTLIFTGCVLLGACYAALSIPVMLPAYRLETAAVFMFLLGASVSILNTPISTYLMEVTPRHMLGRIGSLLGVLSTLAIPLGGFLTGVVAQYQTPQTLYMIMGLFMLLPVIVLGRRKSFREI